MNIGVLWNRLAGGVQEYVENYCLYKNQSKIKPTYEVDYKIDCLFELITPLYVQLSMMGDIFLKIKRDSLQV